MESKEWALSISSRICKEKWTSLMINTLLKFLKKRKRTVWLVFLRTSCLSKKVIARMFQLMYLLNKISVLIKFSLMSKWTKRILTIYFHPSLRWHLKWKNGIRMSLRVWKGNQRSSGSNMWFRWERSILALSMSCTPMLISAKTHFRNSMTTATISLNLNPRLSIVTRRNLWPWMS